MLPAGETIEAGDSIRNIFMQAIYEQVSENLQSGGVAQGTNFWNLYSVGVGSDDPYQITLADTSTMAVIAAAVRPRSGLPPACVSLSSPRLDPTAVCQAGTFTSCTGGHADAASRPAASQAPLRQPGAKAAPPASTPSAWCQQSVRRCCMLTVHRVLCVLRAAKECERDCGHLGGRHLQPHAQRL